MNPYLPPQVQAGPFRAQIGAPSPNANDAVAIAVVQLLRLTRPWVRFLSVMAWIGCVLMFIGGIMLVIAALAGFGAKGPFAWLGLVYVPLAFVYIYPALKMGSYASAISRLEGDPRMPNLEHALLQQKSLWKFMGVLTIVLIVVYMLAIGIAIAVGVLAATKLAH